MIQRDDDEWDDDEDEEEEWDEARLAQSYERAAMQGITLLSAVAQHVESGHLVAFTDLAVAARRPYEAWQWSTLVLREHRGHRLGLAVKLANLDFLASAHPGARLVITGNAAVNALHAEGFVVHANDAADEGEMRGALGAGVDRFSANDLGLAVEVAAGG